MMKKQVIAVVFGGRSVEHDVSILTGLQFLEALDPTAFEALPVYVDPLGQWWTGRALLARSNYPLAPTESAAQGLQKVTLDLTSATALGEAQLLIEEKSLFGTKTRSQKIDLFVPAIHGSNGEDGTLQGLFDFAGVPYAGSRTLGAALTMDKWQSKRLAGAAGAPVLDALLVKKPKRGTFLDEAALMQDLTAQLGDSPFPVIVKPRTLGSSVGVSKVDSADTLMAALLSAFQLDGFALIEPCVTPLVEYNIAVRRDSNGTVVTSAIEQPLSGGTLLDFHNKYRTGQKAGAPKAAGTSEGMASLNRIINPEGLSTSKRAKIEATAKQLFDLFDLAGSVRFDFLSQEDSDLLYFNEVNTVPGSFAYFLWEDAGAPINFSLLTKAIVEEGLALSAEAVRQTGTDAGQAQLFKKSS